MAPLHLYTAGAPNGYKVSIFLEELKAAYGTEYDVKQINLQQNEQKEPWFLQINPNGRIPALVDDSRGGFKVFESAAILLYLAQHYDKDHKLSFDPVTDPDNYSEALQWIFFVHGGVGPMQGQVGYFILLATEKVPYAINRYVNETKRLYSVLDGRLKERDWLAGPGRGMYSIADMNCFAWVRMYVLTGLATLEEEFPRLADWLKRIEARPGVFEGLGVPVRRQRTKEEEEKLLEEVRRWASGKQ